MRTIFVMFDSLNRSALGAYGGTAIDTPNFDRFANRAVTFDRHYVGSLPCMPARRDMHTGRLNFLHRPWGPLEPFDNSYAKLLGTAGVYTHLVSDHLHYFEDGGAGYVTTFDSWDFIHGQEYDPVKALVEPPVARFREMFDPRHYPLERLNETGPVTREASDLLAWRRVRHATNTLFVREEEEFPTARCFASAFDFLELNKESDNFFLQLECFDPHEPFCAPERFMQAYDTGRKGPILDWPVYEKVTNSAEEIADLRGNYAALAAMCDEYFGKLLDWMDENDAWKDTCLILTTDHGFLLGEHEWWGKNKMPYYEEISHIPLMIWHPEAADQAGTRREALTQTTDLMPTFLDLYGIDVPAEATAQSLLPLVRGEGQGADSVIYGMFAGPIGITDGTYSYYHYPCSTDGEGFSLYTVMPAHMDKPFDVAEIRAASLSQPFDFTKGAPLLRVPMSPQNGEAGLDAVRNRPDALQLFDLARDPGQENPIENPALVARFRREIAAHMARHDAPAEMYDLYGLDREQQDRMAAT
ncbi:sulfatase [Marinibacterium profundimaris]|uniref:Sulfatase n=1 Tax=Marinibacterium profundimaris TaxID=1679460 RepID=A0A225NEU7_9RHOB|nr:sulfatase [Marinibacterium profundimaris]OWU71441.1 sulfatase [Marinibacterium profundimaris]